MSADQPLDLDTLDALLAMARERDDLISRLACASEATYWDRPYGERMAAVRGMCNLAQNGLKPAEDPEDIEDQRDTARADLAALRERVEAVLDDLGMERSRFATLRDIDGYLRAALDGDA